MFDFCLEQTIHKRDACSLAIWNTFALCRNFWESNCYKSSQQGKERIGLEIAACGRGRITLRGPLATYTWKESLGRSEAIAAQASWMAPRVLFSKCLDVWLEGAHTLSQLSSLKARLPPS